MEKKEGGKRGFYVLLWSQISFSTEEVKVNTVVSKPESRRPFSHTKYKQKQQPHQEAVASSLKHNFAPVFGNVLYDDEDDIIRIMGIMCDVL